MKTSNPSNCTPETLAGIHDGDRPCMVLEDSTWQLLANIIGHGTPMTVRDPQPARVMRYYRVRVR